MEKKLIGTIASPKGYDGYCRLAEYPVRMGALEPGTSVYIGYSGNFGQEFKVQAMRPSGRNGFEIKLVGVDSKEAIEAFKEKGLFVAKEDVYKMKPGYFFDDELIGCSVYDKANGALIGELIEIWDMPANEVWLVDTPGGELPVPVIDDIHAEIDYNGRIIRITLMDGLMDLLDGKRGEDDDEN